MNFKTILGVFLIVLLVNNVFVDAQILGFGSGLGLQRGLGPQIGFPYGRRFRFPYGRRFRFPYRRRFGFPYGRIFGFPYGRRFRLLY